MMVIYRMEQCMFLKKEGSEWIETNVLHASDSEEGNQFGRDIALEGKQMIIGAPQKNYVGLNSGAAYIFEFIDGAWVETEILTPSDPLAMSKFGYAVDISDNDAIVGTFFIDAPTDPTDSVGVAYVFSFLGDDGWAETKRLRPADPEPGDEFGYSVSVSDGVAFVGAFRNDDHGKNSGSTYIYGVYRPSSITENQTADFLIYPNPIINQAITIKTSLDLATIRITDVSGKLIVTEFNPTSNTIQLPLLASGYYFLQVTTADDLQLSKPIIVR